MNTNGNKENNIKVFDLNIEKILEDWDVYHAIREIIANAIDEQTLTNSKEIKIFKDNNNYWHIEDYGRGINYNHFVQNENKEKLTNNVIGKFGIGLKDALATFYRNNIDIKITSKNGIFSLVEKYKNGFDDVKTLHVKIENPINSKMIGTDFCFKCLDKDIENAKKLFLKFNGKNNKILDSNTYGEIIEKNINENSEIYINGVKVAEEPNFLFSYNITSLTSQLKKSLNRERTNVGRSAYTPRIKEIIKLCKNNDVIESFVDDLQNFGDGNWCDELNWNDIALFVIEQLTKNNENIVFVSLSDLESKPNLIDEIENNGFELVVIPENLLNKIKLNNKNKNNEEKISTIDEYLEHEKENFDPIEIKIENLSSSELNIYNKTNEILKLVNFNLSKKIKNIIIVKRFYKLDSLDNGVLGVFNPIDKNIYIRISELKSIFKFSKTLLHELAHAESGCDHGDIFENKLGDYIGLLVSKFIS